MNALNRVIYLIFFLILFTTSCGFSDTSIPMDQYKPPTILFTPLKTNSPDATPPPPTVSPTSPCINNLRFISDVTYPDGTIVSPGDILEKYWQVENNGTCSWDARYQIKLINGPNFDAPNPQSIYPARSGSIADLHITFTAPNEPGVYRSAWQAFDPTGNPFGDPFFIEFIVQ